jgi:hypothetical protein
MAEIWVAETWKAHGYDRTVYGLYDSREGAFEALKALPNMTVWVDRHHGKLHGRPRKVRQRLAVPSAGTWDRHPLPERWAIAQPMEVQSRAPAPPG